MPDEIGMRVGAVIDSNPKTKTTRLLGYGVYEGDHVPPKGAGGFNFGLPTPRIKLDNGDVVYGCECWWGSEESIKAKIADSLTRGWKVEDVSIGALRSN